jgi:hypothetical protein
VDLVHRHDDHFKKVKQTADALDDSRQMIEIADLVHAKTQRMGYSDSELNISVEEFVSQWISFGKNGRVLRVDGEVTAPTSTQRRRNRTQTQRPNVDSDDEDVEDIGDALQWDVLGERACFPHNNRPPVPSFLLGPLAVQKRIRSTQRQGRQRREPLAAVTKPQDIRAEDLERNEASNLTNQCAAIRKQLDVAHKESIATAGEEWDENMDAVESARVLRKHGLSTNWEVPLLKFAVNPNSFGQTVENLFYISFVIRDGFMELSKDDDGLPTLRKLFARCDELCLLISQSGPLMDGVTEGERQTGAARHQAIFSIDYETWQKLIHAYDITESMIPHRNDEQIEQPNAQGWYA